MGSLLRAAAVGEAVGVGVGVGHLAIWLSGIDTECELAVPTVMMEPGGSCARDGPTNIATARAAKRATINIFMGNDAVLVFRGVLENFGAFVEPKRLIGDRSQ